MLYKQVSFQVAVYDDSFCVDVFPPGFDKTQGSGTELNVIPLTNSELKGQYKKKHKMVLFLRKKRL